VTGLIIKDVPRYPAPPGAGDVLRPMASPPDPNPFLASALSFSAQLASSAANLSPPAIAISPINFPDQPTFLSTERPDLDAISWTVPGLPTEFTGALSVEGLLPEPFDASPPVLAFGAPPAESFGLAPDAPGISLVFDDPTLSVALPAPPSMLSLNVRPFDGISLPAAPLDAPQLDLAAPAIREYTPGAQYASSLLSAVQAELERRITQGGTGLNPAVENAIWDRGREREARTMRDQLQELDRFESLGYALPPGVWLDARLKIATENAAANMGVSREIMIKQAELELEGVRDALNIAQQVEATATQYANQVEQRAFEASRYATEAGISIYNARVQAYTAFLDAYKTKVAIYEAQVRAELSRVDAYRAEVQAEQAKADINRALVEEFKVKTEAALSAIEVYKAEIAGIQTKAQIEKLKIETFGEQVRAYSARVNAYTAGVEAFKATVSAETAKQDAFRSAVQAYGIRVDAGAKVIDARIAEYSARVQAKDAEWRAYTARAQAESERVRAIASKNDAVARMYQAEAGANNGFNEVLGRQWTATTQAAINSANISLEQAKANAELFTTQRSLVMDAAKVGATVSAQLGAAALSANNYSTSFSTSRSLSDGRSVSNSGQISDSASNSVAYNYIASI
jgi:NifU-like protein involved in Fe-S cluster formation